MPGKHLTKLINIVLIVVKQANSGHISLIKIKNLEKMTFFTVFRIFKRSQKM